MNDDELTPSEREAFETLPKERMPSAALEERVVKALRHRGILKMRNRLFVEVTSLRMAGAVAASIALLIGGFALGRWTGPRQSTHLDTSLFASREASIAASLQHTGTAFVLALEDLASLPDSSRSEEMRQGREIALNTLYTAADQVTRFVPKVYLASQFLQAIDVSGGGRPKQEVIKEGEKVIWF